MTNHIASAYDQNPARLALIMKSSRKNRSPQKGTVAYRVLFGLAAIGAYIWLAMPL